VTSASDASAQVARAWDEVALGYDAYFGPRFAPYLGAAVGALLAHRSALPPGAILVPCVGPGRELLPLASAFPDRQIDASDLSSGMVARARERAAAFPNVSVEPRDAMQLTVATGGAAALVSIFGLQLLPDPQAALAAWLGLLAPGGLAAILYWPRDAEPSGPFASMHRVLAKAGRPYPDWESGLLDGARAASAKVREDVRVGFEIAHESSAAVWQALACLGPLRALIQTRGEAVAADLGHDFAAELPAGPLTHAPRARLLLLERL